MRILSSFSCIEISEVCFRLNNSTKPQCSFTFTGCPLVYNKQILFVAFTCMKHVTCQVSILRNIPFQGVGGLGFLKQFFLWGIENCIGVFFVPLHLFYFQWFIYPDLQCLLLAKLAHQSAVPRSCCLAVWCDGLQLWVILNSTFTVIFVQQHEQIWTSVCKGLEWTTSCMSCRFALGNQLLETDCRP